MIALRRDLRPLAGVVALVLLLIAYGVVRPRAPLPPPPVALAKLPARPGDPASMAVLDLAPIDARARNAAVAFQPAMIEAAPPFAFAGTPADRARAVDCLAVAMLKEAGADAEGQRAVAQVVLNRVRHPAYPKSICAVVFQGAERATGCQFTFTCDGALARREAPALLDAARVRAEAALGGARFEAVGTATHYHTDWVHPVWSAQLVKLAAVDTHLFFRWPGYWGSARALSERHAGGEPRVAALAFLSAHTPLPTADAAPRPDLPPVGATGAAALVSGGAIVARGDERRFLIHLGRAQSPPAMRAMATTLCGADGPCEVIGWFRSADVPPSFPIAASARAKAGFTFERRADGRAATRYDCRLYARPDRRECLAGTVPAAGIEPAAP
jgi:spore germination cell wall hydrolase CwlJ-like protein